MATAEEEAIIRKRYLTATVATMQGVLPPFKKLVKKYQQFCGVLEAGGAEEASRQHQELLADLYTVQFHMAKLRAASEAYAREQATYAEKQAQLQASIQQAELDIVARKQELEAARLELRHNQEYEAVKQQIVQVPARSATRVEAQAVSRETADLSQQATDLDALFERRKAQFGALLASIEALHQAIEAEGVEEGALPAEGGAGEAAAAPQQQPMQVG